MEETVVEDARGGGGGRHRPRRRLVWGLVALGGVAAIVVAALAFQPWKLLTDVEVNERDPFAAPAGAPPSSPAPTTTAAIAPGVSTSAPPPPATRTGTFTSLAHGTSGGVRVGSTPDGRQVVFLENLATDNGPDVKVFLSPVPAGGDAGAYGSGALDLGIMKGNKGNQAYDVPAGADLSRYQTVVLWCDRFDVAFGAAGLSPAT